MSEQKTTQEQKEKTFLDKHPFDWDQKDKRDFVKACSEPLQYELKMKEPCKGKNYVTHGYPYQIVADRLNELAGPYWKIEVRAINKEKVVHTSTSYTADVYVQVIIGDWKETKEGVTHKEFVRVLEAAEMPGFTRSPDNASNALKGAITQGFKRSVSFKWGLGGKAYYSDDDETTQSYNRNNYRKEERREPNHENYERQEERKPTEKMVKKVWALLHEHFGQYDNNAKALIVCDIIQKAPEIMDGKVHIFHKLSFEHVSAAIDALEKSLPMVQEEIKNKHFFQLNNYLEQMERRTAAK